MANIINKLRKDIFHHVYEINNTEEFEKYIDSLEPEAVQLFQTCTGLSRYTLLNAIHSPPILRILLARGLYCTPPNLPNQCICTEAFTAAVHQEVMESIDILLSDVPMCTQLANLDQNAKAIIICNARPSPLKRILADKLFPITSHIIYHHGLKIGKECLRIIFDHPSGRHILREFTDGNLSRFAELYYETHKELYKNLQETIDKIRKEQCRINISIFTSGVILLMRMNDFVRRYWGPGGKGYLRIKKRFEALLQTMM